MIDAPELPGFTRYYGVPLCPLGEDGEAVVGARASGADHHCEMCTEIEEGRWWIGWSDQPTEDSFPIVVWQL